MVSSQEAGVRDQEAELFTFRARPMRRLVNSLSEGALQVYAFGGRET